MTNHASRNWRGWVYAFIVATMLSLSLWYGEELTRQSNATVFRPERTTRHSAASTSAFKNIATEELPSVIQEVMNNDASTAWVEFRSQPAMSLVSSLEPSTNVQLMAPQPSVDSLASSESTTSVESESTSQDHLSPLHEDAQLVSSKKTVADTPKYVSSRAAIDFNTPSNSWPRPTSLIEQLQNLESHPEASEEKTILAWAQSNLSLLEQLAAVPTIQHDDCVQLISQLRRNAEEALDSKATTAHRELQSVQSRVAYSILRRTMVWQAALECILGAAAASNSPFEPVDLPSLASNIQDIRRSIHSTGDDKGWNSYLMLDELDQLTRGKSADAEKTVNVARIFLSRVSWQRANDAQRAMLASEPIQRLARKLHPLAYGPVDYQQLLTDIETLEGDPIHRCRTSVAQQAQSLRYAASPAQVKLSDAINTFYRNANLRIAVSEELLQRCMPKGQVIERPVRQKILGADTRGASQIQTKLAIDLVPDRHAWNIMLRLTGDIQSNTRSSKGPATFYNDSLAVIDSSRRIRVDVQGLSVKGSDTNVATHDKLRGFDTDFDSLPLLGDLIRGVVRQQFDSERGIAQRIMKRTIADQTDSEFDKQLSKQVADAEKQFQGKLLSPLDRLELNPLVVDLETTDTRLIARYRIAGASQMAAHTPRPLAPADSHMSIQVHESAINNAIEKLNLPGRKWTLPELGEQLADALQVKDWTPSEEIPKDIKIAFAPYRPMTVELLDGKMQLTLRIADFEQEGGIHLKNFIVRANYAPNVEGLMAQLVREGTISVDGPRLGIRERLPIRTIFSRVFSVRPVLPLLTEELTNDPRAHGLGISQLEIRDGWLAIAASAETSPHVAYVKSLSTKATR